MKVFYRPEQTAANTGSYSPSASKPAKAVADWLDRGLIQPEERHLPPTQERQASSLLAIR